MLRRLQLALPDGLAGGTDGIRPAGVARTRRRRQPALGIASQVLEHLPVAVLVLDHDRRLRHWNRQAMVLLGVPSFLAEATPELAALLAESAVLSPRQRQAIEAYCRDQIPGDGIEPDSCLSLPHGREGRLLLRLRGIGGDRWLLVIEDPLPSHALDGAEAWLDPLTGLTNARGFHRALTDAASPDAPERFGLIVVDLDHFAALNDSFGRPFGDAILCLAARRLRREARDSDLVARHGGDSFAVLARDTDDAEALVRRIAAVLAQPFQADGRTVLLSATAGVAYCPRDAASAMVLLERAEAALATAKATARGGWLVAGATAAGAAGDAREAGDEAARG